MVCLCVGSLLMVFSSYLLVCHNAASAVLCVHREVGSVSILVYICRVRLVLWLIVFKQVIV